MLPRRNNLPGKFDGLLDCNKLGCRLRTSFSDGRRFCRKRSLCCLMFPYEFAHMQAAQAELVTVPRYPTIKCPQFQFCVLIIRLSMQLKASCCKHNSVRRIYTLLLGMPRSLLHRECTMF